MPNGEKTLLVNETDGPFLSVAVFCEKVLQETDGVASLIRIVERLVLGVTGTAPPERMPALQANLTLFVSLKSGFARGSYTVTIRPTSPSGKPLPPTTLPVLLEGDDRGVALVGNIIMQLEEDGLYWFDVLFEQRQLLTRIPLRVVYQRVSFGGPAGNA